MEQLYEGVPKGSEPWNIAVSHKLTVEIEYCTQCRWLMRTAWMAQELLSTFEDEIHGVTMIPGRGGIFEVRVDGDILWSRTLERRFPEIKELKHRVRDRVAPERHLGHTDNASQARPPQE